MKLAMEERKNKRVSEWVSMCVCVCVWERERERDKLWSEKGKGMKMRKKNIRWIEYAFIVFSWKEKNR